MVSELIIPAPAPKRNEVIVVRTPGIGDAQFRFQDLHPGWRAEPGWLWLRGEVLDGGPLVAGPRTVYARPVERGLYERAPRVPLPPCGPELAKSNAVAIEANRSRARARRRDG